MARCSRLGAGRVTCLSANSFPIHGGRYPSGQPDLPGGQTSKAGLEATRLSSSRNAGDQWLKKVPGRRGERTPIQAAERAKVAFDSAIRFGRIFGETFEPSQAVCKSVGWLKTLLPKR